MQAAEAPNSESDIQSKGTASHNNRKKETEVFR